MDTNCPAYRRWGSDHTRAVDFAAPLIGECPNESDEVLWDRLTSIKDAAGYPLTKFPSGWLGKSPAACLYKVRDVRHSNVRVGTGMRSWFAQHTNCTSDQ